MDRDTIQQNEKTLTSVKSDLCRYGCNTSWFVSFIFHPKRTSNDRGVPLTKLNLAFFPIIASYIEGGAPFPGLTILKFSVVKVSPAEIFSATKIDRLKIRLFCYASVGP